MTSLKNLGLSSALFEVTQELGFTGFTPIQEQAIPLLLAGKDLIGQSKTGSGKTAAYSLPILERIRPVLELQALILCPTRELCAQVAREIRKLGRRKDGLQVLVLSGGEPARPQIERLSKGVHIAVGTPGRLLDLMERRALDLRRLSWIVLDEADRMLDMGFQEDIEAIFSRAPRQRQTVFFSATFPTSIAAMSEKLQNDPARIAVESAEQKVDIKQYVFKAEHSDKRAALEDILTQLNPESAIVFCNHKATVAEMTADMNRDGFSTAGLHGDMEQHDRNLVMAKLRNRSIRVLLATDVAARGIDVAGLDLVVNFDLPLSPENYVHRIGRTGRAGKSGVAISIATSREGHKIAGIEAFIHQTLAPFTRSGSSASAERVQTAPMATFRIGGGRKDKLRAGDILGALTGESGGFEATAVGKIEIHDRFAYVAIQQSIARQAFDRLQKGRIKGRQFSIDLLK